MSPIEYHIVHYLMFTYTYSVHNMSQYSYTCTYTSAVYLCDIHCADEVAGQASVVWFHYGGNSLWSDSESAASFEGAKVQPGALVPVHVGMIVCRVIFKQLVYTVYALSSLRSCT